MKHIITTLCAAMVAMAAAAQTVDGGNTTVNTTPTAKQLKAQKAADLKAFKAKQKAELKQFIERQNNPQLATQPMEVVKPTLTSDADTLAYLFGSFQANGLKPFLKGQHDVDTIGCMNDFYQGLMERVGTDDTDPQKHAHMVGTQIGDRIKNMAANLTKDYYAGTSTATISPVIVANAIIASLTGKNEYTITEAQQLFSAAMEQRKTINAQLLSKPGNDFLAENAKKPGVVTTASGLQYKVLTMGEGPKPTASQHVTVNYAGRLIDGTEFDSSYKRGQPTTFGVKDVIAGWTEVLQLMPVGSKWEVYIPQQLGYGDRDNGTIPPYSTLIFTIELLSAE